MTNPDIRAALRAAALAICDKQTQRHRGVSCLCKVKGLSPCFNRREDATAALDALRAAGFAVVPLTQPTSSKEPTP